MRTEIKQLHQQLKTTTVYVTHDQIEAMTMADEIVIMHDGVIEQKGTPLEVLTIPLIFLWRNLLARRNEYFDGVATVSLRPNLALEIKQEK